MISLFLDTSYHDLVISIFNIKNEIYHKTIPNNNDLSINLLPEIKEAFDSLNIPITYLEKIYVVTGPGSFTGLRIGLACAKTLAWSLNIGIVEVSELEFLATSDTDKNYIAPIMDARRNALYAGLYDKNLNSIIEDSYIDKDAFLNEVSRKVSLEEVEFVSFDEFSTLSVEIPILNPSKIVEKHFQDKIKNPHVVIPNYLKKTEAEEKRDANT